MILVSLDSFEQRMVTCCQVIFGEWLLWIFFLFSTIPLLKAIATLISMLTCRRKPDSSFVCSFSKRGLLQASRGAFSHVGFWPLECRGGRFSFSLTDSLFSGVYGLSHVFYRLFYGPLSIREGMNQWKTHIGCHLENTFGLKMVNMEGFTAPGVKISWKENVGVCI